MRLLVDSVAKQWIDQHSHEKAAVWLNTCWEMYKKVSDEPSRVLLQQAIDDVMKLSGGTIIIVKHDIEAERKFLQQGFGG